MFVTYVIKKKTFPETDYSCVAFGCLGSYYRGVIYPAEPLEAARWLPRVSLFHTERRRWSDRPCPHVFGDIPERHVVMTHPSVSPLELLIMTRVLGGKQFFLWAFFLMKCIFSYI